MSPTSRFSLLLRSKGEPWRLGGRPPGLAKPRGTGGGTAWRRVVIGLSVWETALEVGGLDHATTMFGRSTSAARPLVFVFAWRFLLSAAWKRFAVPLHPWIR